LNVGPLLGYLENEYDRRGESGAVNNFFKASAMAVAQW
jgi:hypothetical protein